MDSKLLETYHQRMAQIQDVSDVIAVANMQFNKIVTKLGWTRQSLLKQDGLETCPLDENHRVHKNNLEDHIRTCTLRKHNILSTDCKDLPLPPLYSSQSSVVPVFISRTQFKKLGVNVDVDVDNDDAMLLEVDDGINDYKPCNPLDELRFIYSWHKIPQNYVLLDVTRIPKTDLNTWLVESIAQTGLSDDLKVSFVNSMMHWLNELPTPAQICSCVRDLLGENSKMFVLRLWKFLAAKCLCLNQEIPEHTRHEFDFYTTTSMTNRGSQVVNNENIEGSAVNRNITPSNIEAGVANRNITPPLPAEWLFFKLSTEEKSAIYDSVCKTSKYFAKPTFGISELQSETQDQVRMITEFDDHVKGAKSRNEIIAELRDYKRRRQSYRGKNALTKKMSGYDVLRELFEQQMLYLKLVQENERQAGDQDGDQDGDRDESDDKLDKSTSDCPDKQSGKERKERSTETRRSRSRERRKKSLEQISRSRERRSRSRERRSRSRERRSRSRDRRSRSRERRSQSGERRNRSREERSRSRERRRESRRSRSRDRREKRKERESHRSRSRERRRRSGSKETRRRSGSKDVRHRKSNHEEKSREKEPHSDPGFKKVEKNSKEVSNKTYYNMDTNEESKHSIKTEEGSKHNIKTEEGSSIGDTVGTTCNDDVLTGNVRIKTEEEDVVIKTEEEH